MICGITFAFISVIRRRIRSTNAISTFDFSKLSFAISLSDTISFQIFESSTFTNALISIWDKVQCRVTKYTLITILVWLVITHTFIIFMHEVIISVANAVLIRTDYSTSYTYTFISTYLTQLTFTLFLRYTTLPKDIIPIIALTTLTYNMCITFTNAFCVIIVQFYWARSISATTRK